MPAGSLQCPTCGASAASDSRQCGYCGTRLATAACTQCLKPVFLGSKFCPHCGGAAVPRRAAVAQPMPCPRCNDPKTGLPAIFLNPWQLNNLFVDECDTCGGLWLTHDVFAAIARDARLQEQAIEHLGPERRRDDVVNTDPGVRYLACPVCDELMTRRNYARRSRVIVDQCRGHGMWFDHDELKHIIDFIHTGGLTEAARLAAEDEEKRRREQKMLETPSGGRGYGGDDLELLKAETTLDVIGLIARFMLRD